MPVRLYRDIVRVVNIILPSVSPNSPKMRIKMAVSALIPSETINMMRNQRLRPSKTGVMVSTSHKVG